MIIYFSNDGYKTPLEIDGKGTYEQNFQSFVILDKKIANICVTNF